MHPKSKIKAEASVKLNEEQKKDLAAVIESWQTRKGLVIASLNHSDKDIYISFRQVPTELGHQIITLVDEYYKGDK